MIVPSDADYQQTKRIKQGVLALDPILVPLADDVERRYGVRPINILYDWVDVASRHRLTVIFEHHTEAVLFRPSLIHNDPEREQMILDAFRRTRSDAARDRIFVIINAFDSIARAECNESISQAQIDALKRRFAARGVWEISRFGSIATFFFHTDQQLADSTTNGLREELRTAYYPLMKTMDEFGYFTKENYYTLFDSKENFEQKYEGNWYYYYS